MTRRAQLIEAAPYVQAQHIARILARSARHSCNGPFETKPGQIETLDKRIDNADQCFLSYIVIDTWREKACLISILTLNEATHRSAPTVTMALKLELHTTQE